MGIIARKTGALAIGLSVFSMFGTAIAAAEPPVAMVEEVAGAPGIQAQPFDYLYSGQQFDLGDGGQIVVAYFVNCRVETISGGSLTVGTEESEINGGTLDVQTRECQGASPVEIAAATEAGAGVIRISPFTAEDWDEWNVKFDRPVFKWEQEYGLVTVEVRADDLDGAPLWTSQTEQRHIRYPDDAPTLTPAELYQVVVTAPDGTQLFTMFSVDPWLDVADSPLNRIVPLRPKAQEKKPQETQYPDPTLPTGGY